MGLLAAGQQLKASLDGIQRLSDSLWRLADAFASLSAVADESGETGNAELAGALSDFVTGWSEKRDQWPLDTTAVVAIVVRWFESAYSESGIQIADDMARNFRTEPRA